MTDVFDKARTFAEADRLREAGLYPYYRTVQSGTDPEVIVDGRPVLMLGSNNYLGLASHPKVQEAANDAIAKYGAGCAGSRLLNGSLDLHVALEEELAAFLGRDAALTFSTGYQVNLGVLSALVGRGDRVFLDALDHACIIDGARLGFGKRVRFAHNDADDLGQKLAEADGRGKLVVVDGVYSMEGDLAALPAIVSQCREHGARLMVDEAHSLGVFGLHGRGVAEHFDLEDRVDLVMGTFSKALATVGGFVAGDGPVIDYLRHHARTAIFSAAAAPPTVAAARAALAILQDEPERRDRLWRNTHHAQARLAEHFDTGASASPVIPVFLRGDHVAFQMTARLLEEGVFVNPVVPPAVPAGTSLLRTSVMATHTLDQLDRAIDAVVRVARELDALP